MSTIDEIMGAIGRHGDDCIRDGDAASASFEALRDLIAAALADARRDGAEAMHVAQDRDCVSHMMVIAGRAQEAEARKNGSSGKSIRRAICNAIAQDKNLRKKLCSGEQRRALPLPTGELQAVRHVGDSRFESWFSMQPWSANTNKQHCRDSYAAGMGDGNG